jgi:hypothetical protein
MPLKPAGAIFEPDPRNAQLIHRDAVSGDVRSATVADFHVMMTAIELNPDTPPSVRMQFDVARNAFLYSWFVYDFSNLAELQAYGALETALREKVRRMTGRPAPKRHNLGSLIQAAESRGWLRGEDFGFAGPMTLLEAVVVLRNDLAHGSDRLMPIGSHDLIRFCAEIINKLFPRSAAKASISTE